jgi:hypothetical protein
MGEHVILSSTTDSQENVEAALESIPGNKLISAEEASYESPINETKVGRGGPASTTDPPEVVEEIAKDMREERDLRADEYVGKSRRKLISQVGRLYESNKQLRERVEELERGKPQPANGAAQNPPPVDANANQAQQFQQQQEQQRQQQWELQRLEANITLPWRVALLKQQHPDAEEVMSKVQAPQRVLDFLPTQPDGLEVGYALARNPNLAQQILDADQRGDHAQVAGILQHVSNTLRYGGIQAPQRNGSAAPPPIRHVGGGGATPAAHRIDDPNVDYKTYKRLRDQQEQERKR